LQSALGRCFASNVADYDTLMNQWSALAEVYSGWSLKEIKKLSPRERINWLEIAREKGKVKKNG